MNMDTMQQFNPSPGGVPAMPPYISTDGNAFQQDGNNNMQQQFGQDQFQNMDQQQQFYHQQMMMNQMSMMGMMAPPTPIANSGNVPRVPKVRVTVDGVGYSYHLTQDDLSKVFSRYGQVTDIELNPNGDGATIQYLNMNDAVQAVNDLDNKILTGTQGSLRVAWAEETATPMVQSPVNMFSVPGPGPYLFTPTNNGTIGFNLMSPQAGGVMNTLNMQQAQPQQQNQQQNQQQPQQTNQNVDNKSDENKVEAGWDVDENGLQKFCCRFDIGIANDDSFRVARRIIGNKGLNMKRIVRQCDAKLRLRGQGSGYLEGAAQVESSEPLHLCISCKDGESYSTCISMVRQLLTDVYEDYATHCADMSLPAPQLKITCRETSPSGTNKPHQGTRRQAPRKSGSPTSDGKNSSVAQNQIEDPNVNQNNVRGGANAQAKNWKSPPRPDGDGNYPAESEIIDMIEKRNLARKACNFKEADRLREELRIRGIALLDEPGGRGKGTEVTTWRYWR